MSDKQQTGIRIKMSGTPPNDPDAEISVLGAMMQRDSQTEDTYEVIRKVSETGIKADDFYKEAHIMIYRVILSLYERKQPIDILTVTKELEQSEELDSLERSLLEPCPTYLNYMMDSVPSASPENAAFHAATVMDMAKRRRIINCTYNSILDADNQSIPVDTVLDGIENLLMICKPGQEAAIPTQEAQDYQSFPEIRQKLFLDYIKLFDGVTEAPDSYHFFGFATAMSMMLGRGIYVMNPRKLFTNMFVLVIGRPGMERKTTALGYVSDLVKALAPVQLLPTISSYEGLLEIMSKPPEGSKDIDPARTLVVMSEFNSLLSKARNENLSNIIPNLNDLYDCPKEARTPTKTNPTKVEAPFLSIISGIQPGVIGSAFRSGDIHGGFASRWMYVNDVTHKSIPRPPSVDKGNWNELLKELSMVSDYWQECGPTEMKLTKQAGSTWETFYNWWKEQDQDSELLKSITVRIPDHVLKLSMIFSALDRLREVDQQCVDDAVRVGVWLMRNIQHLFGEFGQSEVGRVEKRLMDILAGGVMTRRQVYQKVGGKVRSEVFRRAVENLKGIGAIEETKRGRKKLLRRTW